MGALAELGKLGVRSASSLTAPTEGLGTDRAIPVLPMLRGLLPYQGLVRGSVVSLSGIGATSLMFALLAEATQRGSWAALVGVPGLGLAAAAGLGVALERVAVIPDPGPEILAVAATLLDGVDLVVVACQGGVAAGLASQLAARARKAGSVLLSLSAWPGPNMTITAQESVWLSRGRLRCRRLSVKVTGRGGASRPAEHQLWLPDDPSFRAAYELQQQAHKQHRRLRSVS